MKQLHSISQGAFWRKCLAYVKHMLSMSWTVLSPTCHVSARIGQASVKPLRMAVLFLVLMVGVGNTWGGTATFTPTNSHTSEGDWTQTDNGVTISWHGTDDDYIKVYKGQTLTVESSNTITALDFTFSNGSNNGGWNGSTASYSETNLSTTSWSKTTTSGKSGKQARITQLVVTFSGGTTYTVDYAAGTGASGTVPTAHTGLSGSTSITLKSPDNLTAPSGKCFRGWTNDSGTHIYAAGAEVTVTAATTFTAVWVDKPVVYLKNTMNWANAYVYFYKGSYWDNSNGSGSTQSNTNWVAGPVAMTWNESTGLFSYTCPSYYTYTYVSFTKDSQSDYGNFYDTEAIYCNNDFQYDKVVVPNIKTGNESKNSGHALYFTTYEYQTVATASGTGYYFASSANTNAWETKGYEFTAGTGDTVVYSRTFTANQSIEFKVYHHGENRGSNGATVAPIDAWDCSTGTSNWRLCIGPEGTYTFKFNKSTNKMKIIYPPVSHPAEGYAYFKKPDGWSTMKVYIYTSNDNRVSSWETSPAMEKSIEICQNTYYYAAIPCGYSYVKFHNNGATGYGNETSEMSATSANCGGKWGDINSADWHNFETYTFTYAAGTGSGTMTPTAGICPGSSQAVAANEFDGPAHYHFNGWTANTSVTVSGESTTSVGAGATIQNVQGNVTLTANWAPDTYTISSTLNNCSYSEGAISTPYTYNGSAANISRTIVPSSGYALPTTISVTMGGNALTAGTDYTYNSSNGAFQITATITGAIAITVTAVQADIYKSNLHTGIAAWSAYASGVAKTGNGYTIPNPGDIAAGDREDSECQGLHYHFVGWISDANKGTINSTNVIKPSGTKNADGTTYWAVWAKEPDGGGGGSIELNYSNLDLSTSYAVKSKTIGGVDFTINQGYKGSGNCIQMNSSKGSGILYNTSPITGLDSIKLYCTSDNGNKTATIYRAATSKSTSSDSIAGTAACAASTNYKIDFNTAGKTGEYFTLKVSGATYFSKIEIYYSSYTDSIIACAPVTCGVPTGMSSSTPSAPTAHAATLSWTAPSVGNPSKYTYYVWAEGTTEPTSGFSETANTSVSVSGLLSNTTYNWKVSSYCGAGDESSFCAKQTFTTAAVTLTLTQPSGSATQSSSVALPSATVPTACGDCWVFAGWTTSSSVSGSSAPATLFAAGDYAHVPSGSTTLYAVYKKEVYELIDNTSDLEASEKYVLTTFDNDSYEQAITASVGSGASYAASTNVTDKIKAADDAYYLYNPSANIVWTLSGSAASGRLYNTANDKYIDLSAAPVLKTTTTDNLVFTIPDANYAYFNIASATTSANKLYMWSDKDWGISSSYVAQVYIYKYSESTYATSPSCPTYTVTWNNHGSTSTCTVSACEGALIEAQMPDTTGFALDCADLFVGWSATNLGSTKGQGAPSDLFISADEAPFITKDTVFYGVYATGGTKAAQTLEYDTWTYNNGTGATSDISASSYRLFGNGSYIESASFDLSTISKVVVYGGTYGGSSYNSLKICDEDGNVWKNVTVVGSSQTTANTYTGGTKLSGTGKLRIYSQSGTGSGGSGGSGVRISKVEIFTLKDFVTNCCDKIVTLTSHVTGTGTVSFSSSSITTCEKDSVIMTIRPQVHYQLTSFSTTGEPTTTAVPTSMDPVGGVTVPSDEVQNIKLRYNANITGAYHAYATFSAIPVSSLTLQAVKVINTADTILKTTSSSVALSMYPREGRTSGDVDPLGRKVFVKFGTALPENALDKTYIWSATVNGSAVDFSGNVLNNNAVIEFNKDNGKLVAKAAGTAVLTVTANDGSGVCASVTITVADVSLTGINLSKNTTTLYEGQVEDVSVTYSPTEVTTRGYTRGSYSNLTTTGSDNFTLKLIANATISAETTETVTITASADNTKTASIDVTIKKMPVYSFTDYIHTGGTQTVKPGFTDNTNKTINWDITAPSIVDNTGGTASCESPHKHLVGWIPASYADEHPNLSTSDYTPANGFVVAGGAITVNPIEGDKTYYAVWAQEQ